MLELIKQNYWWPGLKKMSRNIYKDVSNVNKTKFSIRRSQENYTHWRSDKNHGKRLVLTLLDLCPKSNGMDIIVVIIDWFTKMIRLKVTTTSISSEEIAKIYRDDI